MRNSLKVLLMSAFMAVLASDFSFAIGHERGAKGSTALNYTTTVTTITTGPSVLYGVVMSTVTTSGDYTVIWDSGSVTGLAVGGPYTLLKMKLVGSTTAQAVQPGGNPIVFDPPIQFTNGIAAVNSAATNTVLFLWEPGIVAQGN